MFAGARSVSLMLGWKLRPYRQVQGVISEPEWPLLVPSVDFMNPSLCRYTATPWWLSHSSAEKIGAYETIMYGSVVIVDYHFNKRSRTQMA